MVQWLAETADDSEVTGLNPATSNMFSGKPAAVKFVWYIHTQKKGHMHLSLKKTLRQIRH